RQAYGYDPVNQLAVSEMERMLRLQEVKEGNIAATAATAASDGAQRPEVADGGGTPPTTSTVKPQESIQPPKPEPMRTITFSGDLKTWIRKLEVMVRIGSGLGGWIDPKPEPMRTI